MKRQILVLFIAIFSLSSCAQNYASFDEMAIVMSNGSAPKISVKELKDSLDSKVWLIDVREKEEFDVSHIKGAMNLGEDFQVQMIPGIDDLNQLVVVYCSVGYRSEKVAERLKLDGFTNVFNLHGGIFDWVNSGHPVYDNDGKVTDKIHGYSESWGKWIIKGEKVYE